MRDVAAVHQRRRRHHLHATHHRRRQVERVRHPAAEEPQGGAGRPTSSTSLARRSTGTTGSRRPTRPTWRRRSPAHLIDFTQINGIDGFLNLIEQALNTASFGGKLPLVGNDLQQGADFIGKLARSIHHASGSCRATASSVTRPASRDWVNTKLKTALDERGLDPQLVTVDTSAPTRSRACSRAYRRAAHRAQRRPRRPTSTRSPRTSRTAAVTSKRRSRATSGKSRPAPTAGSRRPTRSTSRGPQ